MSPHQLVKSILIFALAGYAVSGFTADITIANGQEVLTTQSSTADGDVITIEQGGKITTTPDNTDGVLIPNINVSLVNSGAISTQGAGSDGVESNGDGGSISNSGSITTQGNSANGILTRGVNTTINNSGSILLQGNTGSGIRSEGDATAITNSGSITTQGSDSEGIVTTGNNVTISNFGSITTAGNNSEGVFSSGNNANIINRGAIMTQDFLAEGIDSTGDNASIINSGSISSARSAGVQSSGDNATIMNSGMISLQGLSVSGLRSTGDNASLQNSGSIVTVGLFSSGISSSGADAMIINTGSIEVTGSNSIGVAMDNLGANDNSLNNTGLISATGDANQAIIGGAGSQTVNLGAGSQIIGIIDLGNGNDVVNILGASPSAQLTLVGVESVNIAQGAAAVTDGSTTVTTVDPTGDAVRGTSLSVMTTGVHNMVTRRAMNTKKLKPVQLASLELTPGMLYQERGPLAWAEVFGSRRTRKSDNNVAAHHHSYAGFLGGYERDFQKARVGVMAGYANSNIETDVVSIDTDTNSFFAGGYGHFYLGAINLTAIVLGGYEEHDNDRIVFDNLNGIQNASSEFDSFFFSPSITLSSGIKLSENYEFRPSGTVAYTASWYDSYTESGTSSSNLMIDDRLTHAITSRVQLAAAYLGNEHSEVELRLGVKSRHVDEDDIQATLAGTNFRYSSTADENEYGGFVGANVKVAVLDKLHFVTDLEYAIIDGGEDESEASARLSLDYLF